MKKLVTQFLKEHSSQKPLVVLLGPTASGKTALSLELAAHFNGEIISADSRQVYKYMDIGTDKIMPQDRRGIPHYTIDEIEPDERFTLADFKKTAEERASEILSRGKIPFLVGGTGLYIEAITHNYALPAQDLELRKKLTEELTVKGSAELHKKLEEIDPVSAEKIHPNNIPCMLRALEINMTTGKKKSDQKAPPLFNCLQIGLVWPRELLFERINARVDSQIKRGLIKETESLLNKGYSKELSSMSSLGYREMIQYIEGELTLEQATELLKKNTRHFAKRQQTWFKRDKNIHWFDMSKN